MNRLALQIIQYARDLRTFLEQESAEEAERSYGLR